jgi:hypothetical protein
MSYNSITYKGYDAKGGLIFSKESAICFAPLHSDYAKLPEGSKIVFHLGDQKYIFGITDEIIEWYWSGLNEIGLTCQISKKGSRFLFTVPHAGKDNYLQVLATLVALRYLQESTMPEMVAWAFKYKNKADFWDLFVLMHYTGHVTNGNHAFLAGAEVTQIYHSIGGGIFRLCPLEQFHQNIKDRGKEYAEAKGVKSTGVCTLLQTERVRVPDKRVFTALIQKGSINAAKTILSESPTATTKSK